MLTIREPSNRTRHVAQAAPTSARARRVRLVVSLVLSLASGPLAAHTWQRDAAGDIVGEPPRTPAELLGYCLANRAHCSISVNHLSGGWQRHLEADRLNPIASTYKLVTLLAYAQAVSDGRMARGRRLPREEWARFWIGADGDELHVAPSGPITDALGRRYQIRRAGGRRLAGSLRRSFERLHRPARISMDELVEVMIRESDNAGADWLLHELGERALAQIIERQVIGYHDLPSSINAMFLSYMLNPEQPGRPVGGDRVLDDYSGYESRGYRDELARWFARLEDPDFVARARGCQAAVLPWERRIGACPPGVLEPGEERIRELFNRHSMRSNTRTQTRLMTALLERTWRDDTAREVLERALEFRLDPRRFRDPIYRNRFRRYGAKSGSFRTKRGLTVLDWSVYLESQPRADGSVDRGAVSIHLRDLPGRRPDGRGDFAGDDIDFDLPLRFAEAVIVDRDGLARAVMERMPDEAPSPELLARVRRLQTDSRGPDGGRRLVAEVHVTNIGTAATEIGTEVALYLRAGVDAGAAVVAETPAQASPVPRLAPGESFGVLFDVAVPADASYAFVAVDPRNLVAESSERLGDASGDDVQWQRLRFASVNYRSIGVRRGDLDAGDGALRRASGTAGGLRVRIEGGGEPPAVVGRGDALVLFPGTPKEVVAHIDARAGADGVTLQRPLAASFSAAAFAIRRSFHDIQAWETARQGDLVGEGRMEVGVLYDDGPFRCRPAAQTGCAREGGRVTTVATIDGSVTDANHYMALVVADGRRHRAVAGSGVVLDGENAVPVGIRVRDHHTRIVGLALRGFGAGEDGAAISVERARDVLLEDLLIHDFASGGHAAAGVRAGTLGDFTLRNSIIHDGGTGVHVDRPNATGSVENCTVLAMSGFGIREGSGLLSVRNTIAMASVEGDFQVRRGAQSHNLSSDETAAGPGAITARLPERQFRSLGEGARDLHLGADADAARAGRVLYPGFASDIDGERRPVGPSAAWSMGADQ